ncbi:MAG: flagellin [Phycisphaerales bacterium JB039]
MSRIGSAIPHLRSLGALRRADGIVAQAMERLATGKQINRASDDPAGFAVAADLKYQQTTLERRITAAQRESYRLGAQEGALSVVSDLAIELRGLTVQAASTGGLSEAERDAILERAGSIVESVDFIANTSTFGGEQILRGTSSASLGLAEALEALRAGDFEAAGEAAEDAVDGVATQRAGIGARIQQLESMMRVHQAEMEAVAGELSRIEDADFARETAELVRGQILQQAAIETTRIASENARSVLTLLESVAPAPRTAPAAGLS